MNNKIILICFSFILNYQCQAQLKNDLQNTDLHFIDTIKIDDPILIKFEKDKNTDSNTIQSILVSKNYINSINPNDGSINYVNFLSEKNGYLFFTANRFSCIVNNLLYYTPTDQDSLFYKNLQINLRKAEKDKVWVEVDKTNYKPKCFNGWEYNEIYPNKFLLFLIKGSVLRKCQSLDEIVLKNMDNIYFKILVPVTW